MLSLCEQGSKEQRILGKASAALDSIVNRRCCLPLLGICSGLNHLLRSNEKNRVAFSRTKGLENLVAALNAASEHRAWHLINTVVACMRMLCMDGVHSDRFLPSGIFSALVRCLITCAVPCPEGTDASTFGGMFASYAVCDTLGCLEKRMGFALKIQAMSSWLQRVDQGIFPALDEALLCACEANDARVVRLVCQAISWVSQGGGKNCRALLARDRVCQNLARACAIAGASYVPSTIGSGSPSTASAASNHAPSTGGPSNHTGPSSSAPSNNNRAPSDHHSPNQGQPSSSSPLFPASVTSTKFHATFLGDPGWQYASDVCRAVRQLCGWLDPCDGASINSAGGNILSKLAGACPHAVAILRATHADASPEGMMVRKESCELIGALAANASNARRLMDEGGVDLVVASLQKSLGFKGQEAVRQHLQLEGMERLVGTMTVCRALLALSEEGTGAVAGRMGSLASSDPKVARVFVDTLAFLSSGSSFELCRALNLGNTREVVAGEPFRVDKEDFVYGQVALHCCHTLE
eukprot:jgi/Mesvir1/27256/Mv07094-RA.1